MTRAWWVWSAVALVVVAGDGVAGDASAADGARVITEPRSGMAALDVLPFSERIALERAMAAADARYAPRMDDTDPLLEGRMDARFTARGAHVTLADHTLTLRAARMGRGTSLGALPTARPFISGPEVRTDRGGCIEWWRSLPSGLEHGVTIAERPAGEGELVIEVAIEGDLSARRLSDDAIEFVDAAGIRVASYAHLVVLDADGAQVTARMDVRHGRIAIAVDDEHARYPLVVDPLLAVMERATLSAADATSGAQLGWSAAISSDGSRALIGAPFDGGAVGSARVFLRTGMTWTEEATLRAADGAGSDFFGWSVAISGDGSRALVGAYLDDTTSGTDSGSARVFLRTGATWAEERILLPPTGSVEDQFGFAVALSSDGFRALVGAPMSGVVFVAERRGNARVFVRTGMSWAEEAMLVSPDGGATDAHFGTSVALTADGSRALIGVPDDGPASARVFLRTGTTWAQETRLVAPGGGGDDFGYSVALTADGSRALVGEPLSSGGGSARVFLRMGASWTHEARLAASDGESGERFGWSVTLTSDGTRALIGVPFDRISSVNAVGSARIFLRTGTGWTEEASLLRSGGVTNDELGHSVALTSDGSVALVGALRGTASGIRAGTGHIFSVVPTDADGADCESGLTCLSGFCVDDVCCESACGEGVSDCQGCSMELTGGPNGVCRPLSAAEAATVICGPSVGACDAAEACSPVSIECPEDVLEPATTVCRAPVGPCDAAESCTGDEEDCPADTLLSGVECRASSGACDPAELCFGTATTCPPDQFAPSATVCRVSSDLMCDPLEACDGVSAVCPADISTCGPPDGGVADSGVRTDVGTPVAAGGCACRAAARSGGSHGALAIGLMLMLALRGRGRRR